MIRRSGLYMHITFSIRGCGTPHPGSARHQPGSSLYYSGNVKLLHSFYTGRTAGRRSGVQPRSARRSQLRTNMVTSHSLIRYHTSTTRKMTFAATNLLAGYKAPVLRFVNILTNDSIDFPSITHCIDRTPDINTLVEQGYVYRHSLHPPPGFQFAQ